MFDANKIFERRYVCHIRKIRIFSLDRKNNKSVIAIATIMRKLMAEIVTFVTMKIYQCKRAT